MWHPNVEIYWNIILCSFSPFLTVVQSARPHLTKLISTHIHIPSVSCFSCKLSAPGCCEPTSEPFNGARNRQTFRPHHRDLLSFFDLATAENGIVQLQFQATSRYLKSRRLPDSFWAISTPCCPPSPPTPCFFSSFLAHFVASSTDRSYQSRASWTYSPRHPVLRPSGVKPPRLPEWGHCVAKAHQSGSPVAAASPHPARPGSVWPKPTETKWGICGHDSKRNEKNKKKKGTSPTRTYQVLGVSDHTCSPNSNKGTSEQSLSEINHPKASNMWVSLSALSSKTIRA